MDSDEPDVKKKRSGASEGGVSTCDSDSVQQGASDTQSKRTEETERHSAEEHRWAPEEAEVHEKLRSTLKRKFQHLIEGVPHQGDIRLLHEIYTELYITEGGRGGVNNEHEVRQIERKSWREAIEDLHIKCSDIFKPLYGQDEHIRTVLTKGVAGIGKTISVQKFIIDWAEGKANQDVYFIFPLPFRELNLMKEKEISLVELLQHFNPEIKNQGIFSCLENRVMFIFDGLDECRLPLDFHSKPRCCDVTEPASVDVLLTNLIKGNLLPSARLWITTRPAAAHLIPPECVDQVTEIRGFNNQQKEEYFGKRISDENLANRTITHLKSSRSLYIMCHIPVFCWIIATVVERTSDESGSLQMPKTLTQMYTHFLIIQTSMKKHKYTGRKETDEEIIFKLGKLAFQQLEEGNLIFYEEDLRECGIDVTEASVYSGVCSQIFREEAGLYQGKVFSFVHLSIQEFFAALYVFLCFSNTERSIPDQQQTSQLSALFRASTLHDLHTTAVDLALQSENGHLDLFLRFLLGLSLESNQNLLRHLLPQTRSQSQSSEQTVQYVKEKIRDEAEIRFYNTLDRMVNLLYCLNELNHHAVVEVIDRSSGTLSVVMLSQGEWRTGRFKFEISEEHLDEFDLQKYIKTPEKDLTELLSPDEVLERLVPVVTASTSAELKGCSLTEKSCAALASAVRSTLCSLKTLNLSWNPLRDAGIQHLSDLLKSPHCKLETLVLRRCFLTEKSCAALASAARSTPCSLKTLNLSGNDDLHDAGIQHLSDLLKSPHCKLETLVVDQGIFRKESPAAAASDDQDQAQQDPGAQLLSVDTPKEDYHSKDQQKSCEACTEVPDSSHWVLVEPDVSTEKSDSTYSLSSPAGRYECSESGLRWSCAGQVTLQYRFTDWHLLAGELPHMQYIPAGPSMDIKLISGELQEIHLPHFLCLGGSQSCLKDAVMVLHKQDSGVCLEKCELSRFHAKLVNPSFSILGLFYSLISFLLPGKEVKIHADVQVYLSSTVPFTFRAYLLPADAHLRQLLDNQELKEGYKGVMLAKGRPENPLQMNEFYVFKTTCNANICPGKLNLRRSDIVPNFSEVHLSEAVDFKMELLSSVDQQQHWEATIWKNECFREKPKQGGESALDAADFLSRHRAVLIQKVQNVIQIADHMLSQKLINEEVYANIRAAPTEQEKMRRVFDALVSHGAGGKREFLGILQRECPDLLQELGR